MGLPTNDPAAALGAAIGNALVDAILAPAAPKTPEQLEQERQDELARQKAAQERAQKIKEYEEAQARAKQEKELQLDREAQDSLALLGASAKAKPSLSDEELLALNGKNDEKKSDGYQKAFNHAVQCISRNAGTTCSSGTAEETAKCVRDYNAGYDAGAKKVEMEMAEAYDAGYGAGSKGAIDNGAADPRAIGGCRVNWIEAYSRGHFAGKEKNK